MQITQRIWKRWKSEYLGQMHGRRKWFKSQRPGEKIGSMVFIKDKNLAQYQWCLGSIVEEFPGNDRVNLAASKHPVVCREEQSICYVHYQLTQ